VKNLSSFRKIVLVFASFTSIWTNATAQDTFLQQFESFTQGAQQNYDSFRDKSNAEFANFLKKAWQNFEAAPEVENPKEDPLPPVKYDGKQPVVQNELPILEVVPAPMPQVVKPQPAEPVISKPVKKEEWFDFSYSGTAMKVRVNGCIKFHLAASDESHVADAWRNFQGVYFDNLLSDCLGIKDRYKLCDWAYLNMLSEFASSFLGKGNEAVLLTAYLYSGSGYCTRLGRAYNDALKLLYGCDHIIFGKPYFTLDKTNYYVLGSNEKSLNIAHGFSFPGERPMNLVLEEEPMLDRNESEAKVLTSKKYQVSAECSVNKNLVDFFSTYPSSEYGGNFMTRWAIYANTPLDKTIKDKLYPVLFQAISGKDKPQATDILLNFVQTAFPYEYDNVVWGEDRVFFSEETLYYPYCDCEDRSILFSRLVRDLLGLDVILIYYPGHIATAVNFGQDIKGDYLTLKSGRYYICDPTYIGAPIGCTMKGMNNEDVTVIMLK